MLKTLKDFIFSSSKTIDTAAEVGKTIVDGAVSGMDKIWYTEEEKEDNAQKRLEYQQRASELVLQFWDKIKDENTEQSKARRLLANMTFQVFFFLLIMGGALYKFDASWAAYFLSLADRIEFIISAITLIYFGPHQIQKIFTKKE